MATEKEQVAPVAYNREEPDTNPVAKAPKPEKLFGVRHFQVCLLFVGVLLAYTLRVNLSVAIVAMIDNENANPDFPEYDWDEGTVAIMLSSFYWGYFITQVPAGELAQKVGPMPLLVGSLFFSSLFSTLTPLTASWGSWYVISLRIIQGLCQGFIFPSAHTLLSRWCPVEEREVLSNFAYSGAQLGTIITLPICGVLSVSNAGWPSCFYIFPALGAAWAVLWFFFGYSSPAKHNSISKEEKDYILDSIGTPTSLHPIPPTPWKSVLTSLPMLAIVFANSGHGWGFTTLLTELPTFMKYILGFDLASSGFLSALPYIAMFLLSFVFSSVSGFVNSRGLVTLTTSRKIFNTIGLWGPAVCLVGVSFCYTVPTSVALLTLAVGINSAIYVGFHVNHIDLAPNYAGSMMGLSNGTSIMISLLAPLVVGVVVTDFSNESQWRTIFYISSGVYFVTNSVFLIFGTAKTQKWNEP